ncbi:MAG: restriction endonuclease subunit S [Eubacteriales bacterium]
MAKKKETLSLEEKLEKALVPDWEQPYKVPSNWVWTRLPNAFDNVTSSNKKLKQKDYLPTGEIAVVDQGKELVGGYSNNFDYMYDDSLPVVLFGDHTRIIKFIDFPFIQGADGVKLLRPKSYWDEKCFYYALQNINIEDLGYRRHFPIFPKLKIPLPPLAEQKRMVERIESLFSKLDEAKELAQSVLDSFENRKSAILHKAFTGELTKKWREENQSLNNGYIDYIEKAIMTLSNKDAKNLKNEVVKAREFEVDKWISLTIGAVGIVSNGSTPSRRVDEYWNGSIPWVSSGEVRNSVINSTKECITEIGFENSSVRMLQPKTVLVAMIGEGKTRGQSALLNISATINQNIAAIQLFEEICLPELMVYWLQKTYKDNRTQGGGTGPQALNCQKVRELKFILPPLEEQKEIVRILDSIFEKETKAKECANVIAQIDLMKKAILARAFRGELGTNDQSDESAVELLKKILEEN